MAILGVIPAAGYATRLQPLAGSKELLEIGGRPVMDYVVDRMRAASCDDLCVVTRPEKVDVVAHARELGLSVVLAHPATTSESFAAGMEGAGADDVVLLGWPDTIWEPEDGFVRLLDALDDADDIALGLFETTDLERYDVVAFDPGGRISGVHVKPSDPPSTWIWGCAAARRRALAGLECEEWPGTFFDLRCRSGAVVRGVQLSNVWSDIGTRDALDRARSGSAPTRGS